MATKLTIKKDDITIFDGDILNIPIKEKTLINRSIERFGDDDPCIIHQSYIVKELSDELIELFHKHNTTSLQGEEIKNEIAFLDYTDLNTLTLHLEE